REVRDQRQPVRGHGYAGRPHARLLLQAERADRRVAEPLSVGQLLPVEREQRGLRQLLGRRLPSLEQQPLPEHGHERAGPWRGHQRAERPDRGRGAADLIAEAERALTARTTATEGER